MPNLEVHKAISKKRTGDDHEELHKWMDEASVYLDYNHRIERHFYTDGYEKFIKEKWGPKAVVEWLFHIALDNMETAHKFATEAYLKSYDEIAVHFVEKEIDACSFIKQFANSSRTQEYKRGK